MASSKTFRIDDYTRATSGRAKLYIALKQAPKNTLLISQGRKLFKGQKFYGFVYGLARLLRTYAGKTVKIVDRHDKKAGYIQLVSVAPAKKAGGKKVSKPVAKKASKKVSKPVAKLLAGLLTAKARKPAVAQKSLKEALVESVAV